jgi:hypothetical protein
MDRSRRVFGSLKPFDDVFLDVEDADVEYTESGKFDTRRPVSLYHRGRRRGLGLQPECEQPRSRFHSIKGGGLIECSNPLCRGGGYEIDSILSEMRRLRETERKGSISCPGDEGSPKGRRRGSRCGNKIQYTLTVKYK